MAPLSGYNPRMKLIALTLTLVVLLLVSLAACGGDDTSSAAVDPFAAATGKMLFGPEDTAENPVVVGGVN
jgi:hypothetical protein